MPDMVTSIEFSQWWALYPRKVAKPAALRAFTACRKNRVTLQTLLDGVKTFKFPAEQRYIPHPATWLNQRRWEDEGEAAKPVCTATHDPKSAPGISEEARKAWWIASYRFFMRDLARWRCWIAPLFLAREEHGVPIVHAPSVFHARWINSHLIDEIRREGGRDFVVVFGPVETAKPATATNPGGFLESAVCGSSPSADLG